MRLLSITLAAGLALFAATALAAPTASDLQAIAHSSLKIERGDRTGSGVVFMTRSTPTGIATYVVTNHHVVTDPEADAKDARGVCGTCGYSVKLTVPRYANSAMFIGETTYVGKVITADPDADLAVILLTDARSGLTAVPMADMNQLEPFGTKVWSIGYPMGLNPIITEGYLNSTDNTEDTGSFMMQTTFSTTHGGSGGGVYFYDETQKKLVLLGITKAIGTNGKDTELTFMSYTIHVHDLYGLLLRAKLITMEEPK